MLKTRPESKALSRNKMIFKKLNLISNALDYIWFRLSLLIARRRSIPRESFTSTIISLGINGVSFNNTDDLFRNTYYTYLNGRLSYMLVILKINMWFDSHMSETIIYIYVCIFQLPKKNCTPVKIHYLKLIVRKTTYDAHAELEVIWELDIIVSLSLWIRYRAL